MLQTPDKNLGRTRGLRQPSKHVSLLQLMTRHLFFATSLILASAALSAEVAIEKRLFTVEQSFAASILPSDSAVLIQLEPESWSDFRITEIAKHGTKLAKDDLIIRFDAEAIDKKRSDLRQALETSTLSLAESESDLAHLIKTSTHRLDALKRAADVAREDHSYFTKTGRKASEQTAAQSLERSKQVLENQKEELRQLKKMYDADDLTEDTEEIILVRQKNAVIAAEFALQMETLEHQRTMEVTLPREAVSLSNDERDTAIAFKKAEQDIPRSIELKKLEVQELKTAHERAKESLAELENDRKLFEFKAPAAGWLYYGSIDNGSWSTGDAIKALVKHGSPATHRPIATFVPASAKLALTAFCDDSVIRSLSPDSSGIALLEGREDLEIPIKLTSAATIPGSDGLYRADFSVTWPEKFAPAIGSSAKLHLIAYHQPEAISIPADALTYGPQGWTVEIKLADGKTELRPVKRGRISGDSVEILSGLKVGQMLVTSEK